MLVSSIECMSRSFFAKFRTDPPSASFDEASTTMKEMIKSSSFRETTDFVTHIVDANIFDPAVSLTQNPAEKLPFDVRPTGPIFHPEFPYQISLMGITDVRQEKVKVKIEEDNGRQKHEIVVGGSEASSHFSAKHIAKLMRGAKAKTALDNLINRVSSPTKFAIKCAGDWGQVEHCKKYDGLLFTKDKIMALYAILRGVDCILYTYDDHRYPDEPQTPDIYRYCSQFY
jgi:hypothetical protein